MVDGTPEPDCPGKEVETVGLFGMTVGVAAFWDFKVAGAFEMTWFRLLFYRQGDGSQRRGGSCQFHLDQDPQLCQFLLLLCNKYPPN